MELAQAKARAGQTDRHTNLIMGPVQVCWHKFCRYFDVEIREVPMEGERLLLTPEEVVKRCDENTIGVVVTLGVTFTLQFEPVREISDALDKLQAETGPRYSDSRGRRERGIPRALSAAGLAMGFSVVAREIDQRFRAQVRAWRRWALGGRYGARSMICLKS